MSPELTEALQTFAQSERILVALDFDGTVAPFTDNPADSRSLSDAHLAVIRLWQLPRTDVAYVSGRALDSLRTVSDAPPGMLLVGSHGAQVQLETGVPDPAPLSTGTIQDVSRLSSTLEGLVSGVHGAWIEHKPVGAVLHTRNVEAGEARRLQEQARASVMEELPVARILTGHDVLEFSLRETNKGDAIERLRVHTRASAVFYAGDDRTDEDVFRVLHEGDVGVHVGEGRTAAEFTVSGPRVLASTLLTLASLRRRHLALSE